jgi:hypothetical protein
VVSARLGGEPDPVLFEAGYLSLVVGLRLANGADVVVKVRAWQERLTRPSAGRPAGISRLE